MYQTFYDNLQQALDQIQEAGLFKKERIITTPQRADIQVSTGENVSHIETTQVYFRKITDQEIYDYIATKEPLDKAGAYAIQGLGSQFVEKYEGDFNNVVGLPLHAFEKLITLKEWKFQKTQQGL